MNRSATLLAFLLIAALTYAGFAVVAWRRRGPGRRSLAAAGVCGVAGGASPTVDAVRRLLGRSDWAAGFPGTVRDLVLVSTFLGLAVAHVLLCVSLIRAWQAREALPGGAGYDPAVDAPDDPVRDSSA